MNINSNSNIMNISSYPESELLKIASGFNKHLKDKFPISRSNSSGFDQCFIYKFKALFYEIQAHPWEPESDSVTYNYTLELDALADQTKRFFMIFRFYLQKAFPYDSDLCETFGYIEMEKVIHNHIELSIFLRRTVNLINERKTFLRLANCPESTLEEIISLSHQFNQVHEELLKYLERKEISNKTYRHNIGELFRLMEIIHDEASKSLQDDPESLRLLTFPNKEYIQ